MHDGDGRVGGDVGGDGGVLDRPRLRPRRSAVNLSTAARSRGADRDAAARSGGRAGAGLPPLMTALPMGAVAIAGAVRRCASVSARAVLEARLTRIEALDPRLNAFTAVLADRARREAACSRCAGRGGARSGAARRRAVRVKDLYDVAGRITTAGSIINRSLPAAAADAALAAASARGRRGAGRHAEYGRVRLRLHHRERALRADPQSARPCAQRGRIVGRIGGGGGGGAGPIWRLAPTPTDRSACPPPSAASSG